MSSNPFTSAEFGRQPLGRSPDCLPLIEPVPFAGIDAQSDWALLGDSIAVRRLRSQILRVAPYFRTALIRGEQGSGKESVARAIHALSSVADGPFMVADARALAESLDCGKASPSNSDSCAAGIFESARGGTVYLTRVGELSLGHQAELFRFLQSFDEDRNGAVHRARGQIEPRGLRGTDRSSSAHPRILASSSRDLRTLAAIGQFRKDLYARLSVLEIFVPPLRGRIEDIPSIGEWLLHRLSEESGQCATTLTESALLRLQNYPWPNNLRELKSVIRQAAEMTEGGVIEAHHLLGLVEPHALQSTATSTMKSDRLHDVIQRHVLEVLMHCGGNKVRTAELLGISRSTLYRMLGVRLALGGLVE